MSPHHLYTEQNAYDGKTEINIQGKVKTDEIC